MGRTTNRRRWSQVCRAIAALTALAVLAVACGDDADSEASQPSDDTSSGADTTTSLAPQTGGTLTIGQYAATTGFDPAMVTVAGSTNGLELSALYGTLLRYDAETATYEPYMAESLEGSDDFMTWTIGLREGVKFTDGTDYDAAAVKLNIERHMAESARSTAKPALLQFVDSITTPDPRTVVIELKTAWAGFPFMLTVGPGMILSPTAIELAGENLLAAPGDAGAGPFKLESFRAGESVVLTRNPDYWAGEVHLDELRFIQAGAPDQTYLALKQGELQAAYLRDPIALAESDSDGFPSVLVASPGGNIALFNSGVQATCAEGQPAPECDGLADGTKVSTTPPTADVRVRLAIAHALDRDALNERVWNGTAVVGTQLLDPSSQFYADVAFPEYDPEAASELVEEAKAAGWDGTVRVLADSSNAAWGQTVKTLLEVVGITVELDVSKPLSGIIPQVAVRKDYEVVSWGSGMETSDADYFFTSGNFGSANGRYGFASEDFDAALDQLRLASTLEEKQAGYEALSEAWAKDMPAVPIATVFQGVVHTEDLHGLVGSSGGIVFFDQAWLSS